MHFPKKCLQVEKMRDCMVLEGWRWHKLLPSTWRVKVVSLEYSIVVISMFVMIVMMFKVISNGNKGEKKKKIFLVEDGRSLTCSQAMEHLVDRPTQLFYIWIFIC